MPITVRFGPDRSQEPKTQSGSLIWEQGLHIGSGFQFTKTRGAVQAGLKHLSCHLLPPQVPSARKLALEVELGFEHRHAEDAMWVSPAMFSTTCLQKGEDWAQQSVLCEPVRSASSPLVPSFHGQGLFPSSFNWRRVC